MVLIAIHTASIKSCAKCGFMKSTDTLSNRNSHWEKLHNAWMQKTLRPARKLFLTEQFIHFFTTLHSTSLPLTVVHCDPLTLSTANSTNSSDQLHNEWLFCRLSQCVYAHELVSVGGTSCSDFIQTERTHPFMYAALFALHYWLYISLYEEETKFAVASQEILWTGCSQHHLCQSETFQYTVFSVKLTAGRLFSSRQHRGWMQIHHWTVLPREARSLVISQHSSDSVGMLDSTRKQAFTADVASFVKEMQSTLVGSLFMHHGKLGKHPSWLNIIFCYGGFRLCVLHQIVLHSRPQLLVNEVIFNSFSWTFRCFEHVKGQLMILVLQTFYGSCLSGSSTVFI